MVGISGNCQWGAAVQEAALQHARRMRCVAAQLLTRQDRAGRHAAQIFHAWKPLFLLGPQGKSASNPCATWHECVSVTRRVRAQVHIIVVRHHHEHLLHAASVKAPNSKGHMRNAERKAAPQFLQALFSPRSHTRSFTTVSAPPYSMV